MTTSANRSSGTRSSASWTWWRSLRWVSPASRSSSVSPTHSIGSRPASKAAGILSCSARSVSLKYWRRSECPSSVPWTPSSFSIGADTSPVYAPSGSWCMFCASTFTSEPPRPSRVAASAVNGGQIATSTPLPSGSRASSFCVYSRASAVVLNIFQLPAMYGRLWSGVIQRLHSRELLALQQLERSSATGRQMCNAIGEAELGKSRGGIAPAHDRRARRLRDGLRHTARAGRERLHLERAHRPVPEDSPGGLHALRVEVDRLGPHVEAHPAIGHLDAVDLAALGARVELVGDHQVHGH